MNDDDTTSIAPTNIDHASGGSSSRTTVREEDGSLAAGSHSQNQTTPGNPEIRSTVESICQRLLALRGGPPGVHCPLAVHEIETLCQHVRPVLLHESSLLRLSAPIQVCGDVHGQYSDMLRLFDSGGFPPDAQYLFLGDYVDRGKQSIETICLLFCYKILYPDKVHILRGNHEAAGINRIYGFYDECKRRYTIKLWKTFSDTFNCLPPAALIEDKILCMHGGLSPEINTLEDIEKIQRPADVPDVGLLCDLLWSDPDPMVQGWGENDRGVSFVFGTDVVTEFLKKHNLDLVARAHQVVEDGYEFFAGRRLVTLFSAPNYCGEFDNAAAMMTIDENFTCSFQLLRPLPRSHRFKEVEQIDDDSNAMATEENCEAEPMVTDCSDSGSVAPSVSSLNC